MKLRSILCFTIVVIITITTVLLATPASYVSQTKLASSIEAATLPSQYCLRDDYIVYAQHQDGLGYCWNFAATMAASTTIMKATGEYYDFSELWTGVSMSNCSTRQQKFGEGGSFSYQYDAMKKSGLMLESDLPYYNAYTISGENSVDYYNFYERYSNDDLARSLTYDKTSSYSSDDVDAIKSHIYNHGSVYLAFSFRTGHKEKDGVFALEPNQDNTTSNHAVSVIGWDDNYEREYYLDGSDKPTVFRGAWIILNSYTEKNGNDGIFMIFYEDDNIYDIKGYKYSPDTSGDLYFYDKIESGYAYPTNVKGKYYGDLTAETAPTKQKNIFYDDVDLEYSYTVSNGADIKSIDIYLGDQNVTGSFKISVDKNARRFFVSRKNAPYGQYKMIITYGNGVKSDTYLNNFFVTHGLVGEEVEFDYENNDVAFNTGLDLEYLSFAQPNKNYVIYTDDLSGEISFKPTEQSVYSEANMSIPTISYEITDGKSYSTTYKIVSESGYELEYNFTFEYYEDTSLEPVNVYYDLGGGINNERNYARELAGPTQGLTLYAPTRPGYTFEGWYLDYGNGSEKIPEFGGAYCISWDDIHHMGEEPRVYGKSYYKKYYNNSNTVFVYARWVEEEYHNVNIEISGEGSSQINQAISVRSGESVRCLMKPATGWALVGLKINGEAIVGDDFISVLKNGLLLDNIDEDITISAIYEQGVYVSLKYGENVKTAYILGIKDGDVRKFYDGDFIPTEYFEDSRINIVPGIGSKELFSSDERASIGTLTPGTVILPSIGFGVKFSLVVEVFDDSDGYTYVPENATHYYVREKGVFERTVFISETDKFMEFDVGSATKIRIEPVNVTYTVNKYVEDHYISADPNAKSGEKGSATFNAGDIVYLFIKKPEDTFMYAYTVSSPFESIGNCWYRMAICVNSESPDIGTALINRSLQKYTVTWNNWDESVIYSEQYKYGTLPVFNDERYEIQDRPTRPDDDLYTYVFIGWDKKISAVKTDITYTAIYEAVLKTYTVTIEPMDNGTVTPGEGYTLNGLDRHTYIFTPNDGYRIKDVFVNGESVGAVSYYTFENVRSDQTIRVEFEQITYTVSVICGENGSASPAGFDQVGQGAEAHMVIVPDGAWRIDFAPKLGYKVKDVKIDGNSIGAIDSYTFVSIDGDYTVSVEFELDIALICGAAIAALLLIVAVIFIVLCITEKSENARLRRLVKKYRDALKK